MIVKLSCALGNQYVNLTEAEYEILKQEEVECYIDRQFYPCWMKIAEKEKESTFDVLGNIVKRFRGFLEYEMVEASVKNDIDKVKEILSDTAFKSPKLMKDILKKFNLKEEDVNDLRIEAFNKFEVDSFDAYLTQMRFAVETVQELDYDHLTEKHKEFINHVLDYVNSDELTKEVKEKLN